MLSLWLAQVRSPLGSPVLGILIPAIVFGVSFWLAWLLYRHFSRRPPTD